MEPDQDNFEGLRRMLALSGMNCHPRAFDPSPHRVRARLRAGEPAPARSWWERWREWTPLRPALAGACALGTCAWVVLKLGDGTSVHQGVDALAVQAERRVAPAVGLHPLWVGGPVPGGTGFRGASSTAPATETAPSGLFATGAGLHGPMAPAAAAFPRAGVLTGFNRGDISRLPLPTNAVAPVP